MRAAAWSSLISGLIVDALVCRDRQGAKRRLFVRSARAAADRALALSRVFANSTLPKRVAQTVLHEPGNPILNRLRRPFRKSLRRFVHESFEIKQRINLACQSSNVEETMSAVKNAFDKIGEGIKDVAEGFGHVVEGAAKVVGGALTANPNLIKQGAKNFDQGAKQEITGAGEAAGGVAGAMVATSPLGATINTMTNGAATRLAIGAGQDAASTVTDGITGAENMVGGIATGNAKEFFSGALNAGMLALSVVPGVGEGAAVADVAMNAGKDLAEGGMFESGVDSITGGQS
jgi:hypothetical protein